MDGTGICVSPTCVFNSATQSLDYYGSGIIVHGSLKTYVRQKTQTTVISGTAGNTSYGMD
jgi:hypothetical protein